MLRRSFALLFCLGPALLVAEDAAAPSARQLLRARLAEESKANAGKPATPGQTDDLKSETAKALVEGTQSEKEAAPASPQSNGAATRAEAAEQPANVLPKVEVKRDRITELDQQLAQQERAIAREKKNTKATDVDKALNDSKIAKPLAIFGGESTQYRQQVARQRVGLMEEEKDLMEAIAQARTKEEKAELKKQLKQLRAERRELEKAMR